MDKRGLLDLIIARIPGLSVREKISLCENFDGEEDFIRVATVSGINAIIGREFAGALNIEQIRIQAGHDARAARARGIRWVAWNDAAYPPLLREIYDPPAVLFCRGNLPDPEKPLVAIVGTRRPSPGAARQAYDLGRDLGRMGISAVSGLALGIDAMSHRGNLEGGSPTFAVLGSGLDEVYPRTNRLLAQRILETGGGLISEYPPGTPPFKGHFPARNRIISGIARGLVIVEAPESSGALITARNAIDQNRDLWIASAGAVSSGDESADGRLRFDRRGSIKLAENGAKVIRSAVEILKEWNMEIPACESVDDLRGSDNTDTGKALAESLARSLNVEL